MHVSRMATWADLWDAAKSLSEADRVELARFLNFEGAADAIEVLDRQLVDLTRAKPNVGFLTRGLRRVFNPKRFERDVADIKRKQTELEDAIEEQLAGAVSAWQKRAEDGEPIRGLNRHDLDVIQKFLDHCRRYAST